MLPPGYHGTIDCFHAVVVNLVESMDLFIMACSSSMFSMKLRTIPWSNGSYPHQVATATMSMYVQI